MTPPSTEPESSQQDHSQRTHAAVSPLRRLVFSYAYVVLKNLIGWLLIWSSVPVGFIVPGPGGLPLFIIGFAMISFPGKRKLTARVMRGKPISSESPTYRRGVMGVSVLAPVGLLIYLWLADVVDPIPTGPRLGLLAAVWLVVGVALWASLWLGRDIINQFLKFVPRARRRIRPWMRKKGIDLLPPRRRRRRGSDGGAESRDPDPEILEIHERHYRRLGEIWRYAVPWLRWLGGLLITVGIFYFILKPIRRDWPLVREEIFDISPWRFLIASVMFAIFLFFRAVSWRRILLGLGQSIPVPPAVRVWSISELARYLPGAIWQVVGRVYLVKPYGISGAICSMSQVLELSVFLLANVLVALGCLLYFGFKEMDGAARTWLWIAMALLPLLIVLVHPKVFYGLANGVLEKLGKPRIGQRFSGWALSRLLGRMVVALLWQSIAVYLLVAPVLGLDKWDWWWQAAGAYCLAWIAGFIAVWAPGGIGVRELVFMAAIRFVLPDELRNNATVDQTYIYAFLAILLRLWTVAGELILAAFACSMDYRGLLNLPDAPGRISADRDDKPAAAKVSPAGP